MELSGLTAERIVNTIGLVVPLLLAIIVFTLVFQFGLYKLLAGVLKTRHALPYTLLAPAAIAIVLFLIYPLIFNVLIAFSDLQRNTFPCYSSVSTGSCELDHLYGLDYGLDNFTNVFFRVRDGEILGWGRLLRTADSTFPVLLGRTAIWTGVNVIFHFLGGLALALIMNQKVRFKNIYRSIIVLPWAIPGIIVCSYLETGIPCPVRFRE